MFKRSLIFTCLTACSLLGSPQTGYADPKSIKLGYTLALTGKGAFVGIQSKAGAELARRELQTAGNDIEILFEDHQTDAKTAVTGVKKLLEINGVDAVLCDLTPTCTAISPIVAKARKVLLYQAPINSIIESNPYAFKNFLDYQSGCNAVARYWRSHGIKKVGHLKLNTEFGELCLKGSKQVFSNQSVIDYNSGDDLRTAILRLKESGVEVIFQTGYEPDYINRFKTASELHFSAPAGMPEPLLTQTVIAQSSAVLDGTVSFGFIPLSPEFVSRLRDSGLYTSGNAIESAATTYFNVRAIVHAIQICPDRDIDCKVKDISALQSDALLGFQGWINRQAQYSYLLKTWKDGKLKTVGAEQ